ncbi:uncharacterized protein LOC108676221 [Hyalella azteca]|uniref:Uncharacterized protein LOC108676221 n=1 Tax=Hyalella azteca TaxID=294128 RepID=A0A8B7P169_HYAAZ|nr:uncharacterized protein LOC108676221 [Hyalella azteca]
MTLSAQISRPTDRDLRIMALLSTERGRRSAIISSIQCLLSVVGSMGIILIFAGIPQLIYAPVVTVTNVVTFLVGALLLSVMVAGNACISYKFRPPDFQDIAGVLSEGQSVPIDDKPPNYEDLGFSDALPPDYYSVVCERKSMSPGCSTLDVAPTHTHGTRGSGKSSSSNEGSQDNLQRLWEPILPVDVRPRSGSSSSALSTYVDPSKWDRIRRKTVADSSQSSNRVNQYTRSASNSNDVGTNAFRSRSSSLLRSISLAPTPSLDAEQRVNEQRQP